MADAKTVLYEGMFLINQQTGGDLAESLDFIREILTRANAEIVVLRKWDERRLAFPIEGQKRGLYILALFRVPGVQIANIERDCNLSEKVMRAMMIRADHLGETEIELAVKEAEKTATEVKLREGDAAASPSTEAKEAEVAEVGAASEPSTEENDG
jgi:small subunit ribosomal protein S6